MAFFNCLGINFFINILLYTVIFIPTVFLNNVECDNQLCVIAMM